MKCELNECEHYDATNCLCNFEPQENVTYFVNENSYCRFKEKKIKNKLDFLEKTILELKNLECWCVAGTGMWTNHTESCIKLQKYFKEKENEK